MQTVATETARSDEPGLGPMPQVLALSNPRIEAWRQQAANLTLIFSDIALAIIIWEIACLIHLLWPTEHLLGVSSPGQFSGIMSMSIVPLIIVWIGFRTIQGLYPGHGMDEVEELRRQTYALLATLAFAATFALAFQIGYTLSRFLLAFVFTSLLFVSPLVRHAVKGWLKRHGAWGKPVIILGTGDAGISLKKLLDEEWRLGYRPVAFFDSQREGWPDDIKKVGKGSFSEHALEGVVRLGYKHSIDTLFLAIPHGSREYLTSLGDSMSLHFRKVVATQDLAAVTNSAVVARNLAGTVGIEVRHHLLNPSVRRCKRGLDLLGAVVGGLLICPLLVALAILIKLDSPGPAFFAHRRLGADGKHFRCWKFRTMYIDAEQLLEEHLKNSLHLRAEWEQNHKLRDDPRVTRVGRFLRKTSLDELPQLWNVMRADMNLVGPRPIVDAEIAKYGKAYELYKRIRPGMSGLWQVSGRSNASYEGRVAMDAHYIRNWSIWLDLVILARTIGCVIRGRGAC